jgi:ATP-binding cassette subfamily B protein
MLAYLTQFFSPLQNISKNLTDTQSFLTSIKRVYQLLDKEQEVKESPAAISLQQAKGSFEFSHVSFGYNRNNETLRDISFVIQPGERVGIMGSTGAGKSSLISLLMRFYDPSAGDIFIDGKNLREIKLADYRNQFSIVLQEPVLFSTTIAENIRYGKPGATEKEIIEAAKAANAHEFIMRLSEGYNTMAGERGMQLSGGERQRISIARAFVKNAPVLILDEPTSSLDIGTEAQIMESIERLMEGRTTFLITHRLDTLKSCNVLLHLEKGRLVEVVKGMDALKLEQRKTDLLNRKGAVSSQA